MISHLRVWAGGHNYKPLTVDNDDDCHVNSNANYDSSDSDSNSSVDSVDGAVVLNTKDGNNELDFDLLMGSKNKTSANTASTPTTTGKKITSPTTKKSVTAATAAVDKSTSNNLDLSAVDMNILDQRCNTQLSVLNHQQHQHQHVSLRQLIASQVVALVSTHDNNNNHNGSNSGGSGSGSAGKGLLFQYPLEESFSIVTDAQVNACDV